MSSGIPLPSFAFCREVVAIVAVVPPPKYSLSELSPDDSESIETRYSQRVIQRLRHTAYSPSCGSDASSSNSTPAFRFFPFRACGEGRAGSGMGEEAGLKRSLSFRPDEDAVGSRSEVT